MLQKKPLLFDLYPNLEKQVPWIPILSNIPTPIDRLLELEKHLGMEHGEIYIKRDDINHDVYGGNKLRKFEFIFGKILKRKKKGVITLGGIGTNHGLACAITCNRFNPPLKCHLFLYNQPVTWHVQRSLLLFQYFGAKLHLGKRDITTFTQMLFFKLWHPHLFLMSPGGSPTLGIGSPLGTVGFVNAAFELKRQIETGEIALPEAIFVAGGSVGTAAGLIVGCKLAELRTKVHIVAVYTDLTANPSLVKKNANKVIKYLRKRDKTIPKIQITEKDFEFISGYLGSGYGVKTKSAQHAVDIVYELEGSNKGFKLDTTYTGKAMAAMFDYLNQIENKNKRVLFWNTYNSNNLDNYLREIKFNYSTLPEKFHKYFEETKFQCWQLSNCPEHIKIDCPAYLNHEYRFWKVTDCKLEKKVQEKTKEELKNVIELEDT